VALILLPLAVLRRRGALLATSASRGRIAGYFFAIGLAFLFIEIAFMQKFILFLHHPLYAVATVLAAFLVFAGLGSAWTARLQRDGTLAARATLYAVLLIALLGGAYTLLLDPLFAALNPTADCTAGVLHGYAVPARTGAGRCQGARTDSMGMGHQRLCLGAERRKRYPAGDAIRIQCRGAGCPAALPAGRKVVSLTASAFKLRLYLPVAASR